MVSKRAQKVALGRSTFFCLQMTIRAIDIVHFDALRATCLAVVL